MTNAHHPPYPAYKPSGVDWLGDIPAHWEVRRLKFVAAQVAFKLEQKPSDKIYLGLESIESGTGRLLLDSPVDTVESVVSAFQSGDVLFSKLRPYLAKVVHADFDGVCTSELMVLRPNRGFLDDRFLFYFMLSHGFISVVDAMTYGTKMPRASPSHIADLAICLPPLAEQRAIAEYLDRETAHIDALIAKKRALIDLLECQRTALISHAVTRGLNPAVPLKPSGVDWLGDIPAHWEVRRLKFVASVVYSNVDKHSKEDELPVRLCNYTDIYKNERITNSLNFMEATATIGEIRKFALKKGDIIITKDSEEWQDIAVPALVSEELDNVICGYHLALIRPFSKIVDNGYLFRSFQAAALNYQFQVAATGITRYGLGKQALGDALFLVPPLAEQRAIAEYLDRETAQIDRLKGEVEASIDLLQRYRTALISAAVTGKIDVRVPAAASCPSA